MPAHTLPPQPSKSHYITDIARLGAASAPEHVRSIRAAGAAAFQTTEFPHMRMEEWRHTNIGPIVNTPYKSLVAPAEHGLCRADVAPFLLGSRGWTELVFVNGYFAEDLSVRAALPEGAVAGSLWDALLHDSPVADAHLNRYLGPRSIFTHLNCAMLQDGAFVYVPKDTAIATPVHLVFVSTAQRGPQTAAHPRGLFVADTGAQVTLVESHVSLAGDMPYLDNLVVEVAIEPNASVDHYKLVRAGAQGSLLGTTEVHQARDSRFRSSVFALEGAVVRNQLCVALDGDGAECELHGLMLNDRDRLVDNAVSITHAQPHCRSRIAYKGILEDRSRGVFLGKVHVLPEAQQTDSNQLSKYLLLSDNAVIDTKPQLEIYADDVKCTHGATVGAPPEQVIFYFRARGVDEATARGMLTYGFADEVVSEIALESLRQRLEQYVFLKYSPQH
ncbi:MAG: Fe-S cluster assembly protein SufD [Candidatus Hydrogenedentes bacterium]|nr:Fe-S cluster assembly protein SufD [Candidatus Hydrogenedentota bacterium]